MKAAADVSKVAPLRRAISRVLPRSARNSLRELAEALFFPQDISEADQTLYEFVAPFTMTSVERIVTLSAYVRSVVERNVLGDFVECGVWRGGSAMCMARTLLECGASDRHLYLFDTFQGMTVPTAADVSLHGESAGGKFAGASGRTACENYLSASMRDVQRNLSTTDYPGQRVHFIQGPVEATIPAQAPAKIALLRLDTDWYESTIHELRHLYDRVSPGGIVIVDDYGHWSGCRKAVDDFLAGLDVIPVLHRIDYTCRSFVKPHC